MYNYINLGVFSARNINLPRKVKYKKRKENERQRKRRETVIRKGRTYEDFKEYIGKHPECSIVEMDTVEGVKGGKVFLTLLFRQSKFMLIYLMDNKTMECVEKAYNNIKQILGIEKFKKIFEVILTDNGSSFDELTQEKTNLLMSHINNTSRDILNGKTPYEATLLMLDEATIEKLGVIKIAPDEVNLSPNLLKEGDK